MKKSQFIIVAVLFPLYVAAQVNIFSNNKGEVAGKVITINYTGDRFIVIETDTLYMSENFNPKTELSKLKRAHAFFTKNNADNRKYLTSIYSEKLLVPEFKLELPIPKYIWATAANNVYTTSEYKSKYGPVTMWGFGINLAANVYPGVKIFTEMLGYTYKQVIANDGETVHHNIDIGGSVTMPYGLAYSTYTTSFRAGIKYVFLRDKMIEPWLGIAYGPNLWNVQYLSKDGTKSYGKDSGLTWREAIRFGVDFRIIDSSIISLYIDEGSPTADYKITNLFGIGDYDQFDGVTYPTPRIGIAISY